MKMGKQYGLGRLFYLYVTEGLFWFRFFKGYGVHGKNTNKHKLLYSERNGYTKFIKIGTWRFKILKP